MLTGIVIGFVAGQIVGIVAAAFLAAGRGSDDCEPHVVPRTPGPGRGSRFLLSRRGAGRRSGGRMRVVA